MTSPAGECRAARHALSIAISLAMMATVACTAPTERTVESAPTRSSQPSAVEPLPRASMASSATTVEVPSPTPPTPRTPMSPPALAGAPLVEIPVVGFGAAVVAVPIGATAPQRVVLATHGNYDHPDWQCSTWRDIVGPSSFVLCPRGIARPDSPSRDDQRFTYASNAALELEVEAAIAALRERFAGYVDNGPMVYAGFSLGAIMGVAIAARAKHAGRYESLVLVEGGHDRWKPDTAAAFAKAGGKRVLFGCGQASCLLEAKSAAAHLERAGVATKIVGVKNAGHSYGGRVADEVKGAWPFIDGEGERAAPPAP